MRRHPIANAEHWLCRQGFHFGKIKDGPIVVDGKALPARTCFRCGVISTISPIPAGNGFTWTAGFNLSPDGVPTNPTTVAFIYQPGNAPQVTLTWASGQVTNTGAGVFSAQIDTTGLPGSWTLEAIGTGTCSATTSIALTVVPLPLG